MCVSSQVGNNIEGENGHYGDNGSLAPMCKPPTYDRATQTELTPLGQDQVLDRVPLALTSDIQSLSLEDALPKGISLTEGSWAKLHRIQGLEEEDEEVEKEKDLSRASSVEEPIHPTTIRSLQREDLQDPNGSTESLSSARQTPISGSPAPPKDLPPSPRSGPLSTILEGQNKPLCVIVSSSFSSSPFLPDCMAFGDKSPILYACVSTNPQCQNSNL